MQCRELCGACCIAPSIATSYYGMPRGKAAGERCAHLDEALRCALFGDPRRPTCCLQFEAEPRVCGADRLEALHNLHRIELQTLPDTPLAVRSL